MVDPSTTVQDDDLLPKSKLKKFGVRHYQVLLFFMGLTIALAMRTNLSVAIVAMNDKDSTTGHEIFNWDEPTKGLVLSSFFWGYVITQIPGGLLALRFGAKIVYLIAMIGSSITNLLTPVIATYGDWEAVCAFRLINGMFQGCIFPCLHTLLSKWVHPSERSLLSVFTYSGAQFGIFIMMLVSGVIADSIMGWPGIFYISGAIGIVWSVIWFVYGSDSPSQCKRIPLNERYYLEQSVGISSSKERLSMPWKSVFTSVPFLAILFNHMCQNWGYYTLLTEIPAYMKEALDYNIKKSAILSAMPYLVMFLLSLIFSPLSDFLINRQYITVANGRKFFNSIGHWLPAICLIGLGFVTKENSSVAVALLVLSVGFNAGTNAGYLVNHMDLSPNFAGTLMGITNAMANIISIIAPIAVGYIVTENSNVSMWQTVFFITAGIYFVGNLVFVVFGKGTIRKWNNV